MGVSQTVPVGPQPQLVIKNVSGDLAISGWDRPEVHVRMPNEDHPAIQPVGEVVEINGNGDCTIQAPLQTRLRIESVSGDATVSMILGEIEIAHVHGDLSVNNVGATIVGNVNGDLVVRSVAGGFNVGSVNGDLAVRSVAGNVHVGNVNGDLNLSEVVGNIHADADGDARLTLALAPGQQVVAIAAGDIVCQVQQEAGAAVHLSARGDILVKNFGEPRRSSSTEMSFTIGDGSATLQLSANGDLQLRGVEMRPFESDFVFDAEFGAEMSRRAAELCQQITQQVESQVSAITRELEEKLARMGNNDEMATRIQERVQSALRRAEEKFAEVMRKVELRTQEGERRAADGESRRRKGYSWQAPPPPPPPPTPKRPQATVEERMQILHMVEEGKISVEQAEKLLEALNA